MSLAQPDQIEARKQCVTVQWLFKCYGNKLSSQQCHKKQMDIKIILIRAQGSKDQFGFNNLHYITAAVDFQDNFFGLPV